MASEFLRAVKNRDVATTERLLKEGTDINEIAEGGVTALMLAVNNDDYKMVRLLLDHNPDINATKRDHEQGGNPDALRDFTALDYADYFGHEMIAALLRIYGAELAADLATT